MRAPTRSPPPTVAEGVSVVDLSVMRGRSVALGAVASYASPRTAAVDVAVAAAAAATVFYLCARSAFNALSATPTLYNGYGVAAL